MSHLANAVVSSSRRALPLVARRDLSLHQVIYQGQSYWLCKDPLNLKYFRLTHQQECILGLLNGKRSLEQIQEEFVSRFPAIRLTIQQIQSTAFELYQKGLAWSLRAGQADSIRARDDRQKWKRRLRSIAGILFIRFPGWDPHRLLARCDSVARFLFHIATVLIALFFVVSTWGCIAVNFQDFQQRLPDVGQILSFQTFISIWIVLGVTKIAHELGHGLACQRFGRECHEIGAALLIFCPCLYCDVSDSWVLANKWKRIAIGAAGIYFELVISAVAFWIWWWTHDGAVHQMMFQIFVVCHITTVAINLNPLLRLDGYYMLSDWLEVPNLRSKSDNLLDRFFVRSVVGIRPSSDPLIPERMKIWFIGYALASAVYRCVLVVVICLILYSMLKPFGLQFLGLFLGLVSLAMAVIQWAQRIRQIIRANSGQQVGRFRLAAVTFVVALLSAVVTLVPVSVCIRAPVVIEHQDACNVYVTTAGRLVNLHVQPGEHVDCGQVLMTLENVDKSNYLMSLQTAKQVQEIEQHVQRAIGDASQESLALGTLRAIDEEVDDYKRQISRLIIRAPCAGTVVASKRKSYRSENDLLSLPGWQEIPLDRNNLGCYLESGTHVLSIAPSNQFQAVILITQDDRPAFQVGRPINVKLDHLPRNSFPANVQHIADAQRPSAKSIRIGDNEQNPLTFSQLANYRNGYRAIAVLNEGSDRLHSGVSGIAYVWVGDRTIGQWIWRSVRGTFNFQL